MINKWYGGFRLYYVVFIAYILVLDMLHIFNNINIFALKNIII